MAVIINIFGAPGSGKTTAAAELFSFLKRKELNVGLITEYATFKILENNLKSLNKQYYITSKQLYNQEIAEENYDFVITDSPILLGIIYNNNSDSSKKYNEFLLSKFKEKTNINVLLKSNLNNNYSLIGRVHKKYEIKSIEEKIKKLLDDNNIEYKNIYSFEILTISSLLFFNK